MTTTELFLDAPPASFTAPPGYHVRLALGESDVQAAGRLRARTAALGRYPRAGGGPGGPYREPIDDLCDHLVVWHRAGPAPARPVATCRLLPPHGNDTTPRGAGLDADRAFGLMPLERLLDSTVEIGGCCVHPDHRGGGAATLLFGGVARYLHLTGYRHLLGRAGVDARDGGAMAAAIWDHALTRHLAPAQRRCRPRDPLPIGGLPRARQARIPAPLRAALRLGAKICGPPARGTVPGTAEFLVLLDLQDLRPAYRRRLSGTGG